MEAQHEQADILDQKGDQSEQNAGADGDQGVGPHG